MAEVVGLVAAGAQLLELTFEVISLVKSVSSEIRDEVGSGARQLSQANALLALVQEIQQDSPPFIEERLKGCLGELRLVHSKLVDISAGSRQGRLNRVAMAFKFKAHEKIIVSAWKRFEDKMQVLSVALQWKSFQAINEMSKRIVSDIPESRGTLMVRIADSESIDLRAVAYFASNNSPRTPLLSNSKTKRPLQQT